MSGPKMVGITCDPEVIARNNARLKQIGKDNYYKGVFENINTDISNTALWVKNYGNMTLNGIPDEYGNELGLLQEVKQLKEDYANKLYEEKLNISTIKSHSAEQLNKIGVQKVQDIPKWKEKFLREISIILKKLQKDIEKFNAEMKQVKRENKQVSKESRRWMDKIKKEKEIIENVNVKKVEIERYLGDEKSIPFMPEEESKDSEAEDFSIEELALLEMLQSDLEEYSKLDYLSNRENKLIHELSLELKCINDTSDKAYSMRSKRAILQQMRMEYVRLEKYVSMQLAAKNAQMEERNTLELEYVSFCQALDINQEKYQVFSIQELRERVKALRSRVEKQESRIYIEI